MIPTKPLNINSLAFWEQLCEEEFYFEKYSRCWSYLIEELRRDSIWKLKTKFSRLPAHQVEELFQDSCFILYEKIRDRTYDFNKGKLSAFFWKILFYKARSVSKTPPSAELTYDLEVDEDITKSLEKEEAMLRMLQLKENKLEKDCRKVLNLHILDELTHDKIAEIMNYSNEGTSRKKKYRCVKYFKKILITDPIVSKYLKKVGLL